MAFFSFSLLKEPFTYLSEQIVPNKKYYSKNIALWKELNKRNKKIKFCNLKHEIRLETNIIGKKILICLPPRFGLGDAVEYGIAIKSLIESKKFSKIGIAFCSDHSFFYKKYFLFLNIYSVFISEDELKKYDTVFHITLEINALRFQKYKRSNIAVEICNHFKVSLNDFKIVNKCPIKNFKKTLSIFPVSTSVLRSLPYEIIEKLVKYFKNDFQIRIIIDDSYFSKYLENKNKKNNFLLVKPKDLKSLILEISKINFGIFVDSGPLHLAKIFDKSGILVETSVSSKILLTNSNKIYSTENKYSSNYCDGPCGLVDVFAYNKNIGCYETNKTSFENIRTLKSFKNLQRWNKKDNNSHFILNPVGCIRKIDVKNIIELIEVKIKEN